jgi:hypothetical protein
MVLFKFGVVSLVVVKTIDQHGYHVNLLLLTG